MKLIQALADLDVNAWISDVDTVYLRNPIPVGKSYPRADVLVSTDHLGPSSGGLLDRWPDGGTDANIGLMLVRPTAKKLLEAWVPALEIEPWDQSAFNYLLRKGLELESEDPPLYRSGRMGEKMGMDENPPRCNISCFPPFSALTSSPLSSMQGV